MIQIRTPAFLLACCSLFGLGCSTRVEKSADTTGVAVANRTVPSQSDFDREEAATRAEYLASSALPIADPSVPALAETDAKRAAHLRAVERAMEYCRPQAELASRYFDDAPSVIYIEAIDECRRLGEKHIEAEVVALIEGGTRVLIKAGAGDHGNRSPGRDRSFRSYATRYGDYRRNGLSHEQALIELEGLAAR